jgi:hypothetical protein
MALLPVTTYAASWNAVSNQGRVLVQIGNAQPTPVPVDSQVEFILMLQMLGKNGVQFDTQTRDIQIPLRAVGT